MKRCKPNSKHASIFTSGFDMLKCWGKMREKKGILAILIGEDIIYCEDVSRILGTHSLSTNGSMTTAYVNINERTTSVTLL